MQKNLTHPWDKPSPHLPTQKRLLTCRNPLKSVIFFHQLLRWRWLRLQHVPGVPVNGDIWDAFGGFDGGWVGESSCSWWGGACCNKKYSKTTARKQIMQTSHRRTHTKQWVWSFHLFILPNLPTEKNLTKNLPGEFWTLASKKKNERKLFTWQLGERSLFGIKFTAWITVFNSDPYNGLL